jgi:hypothetical protein
MSQAMTLPELIANSPVPGTVTALTTLKVELKVGAKELEAEAAAPSGLHAEGQFRIVLGNELLLVEGPSAATTKWKILERAAEGSTEAAHAAGTSIYHVLTAAALKSVLVANSPVVNKSPVIMRFGTYEPNSLPPGLEHVQVQLEVGNVLSQETGEVFQVVSGVENTGGAATVAFYGYAIGKLAWGANFLGYTRGKEQRVTGVEIDFGHLTANAETEPETGSIANGLTIEYFPHKFPATNEGSLIQLSAKHSEGGANLGCKYGIRMFGASGTQGPIVHPTEGTVIYYNTVNAKYGIDFGTGTMASAVIRFGEGHNLEFGTVTGTKIGKGEAEKIGFWGATPIVRPKVTGSRASGAALKSLLEQLATAGLIVNESSA